MSGCLKGARWVCRCFALFRDITRNSAKDGSTLPTLNIAEAQHYQSSALPIKRLRSAPIESQLVFEKAV